MENVQRINVLKVPVDIVPPESLEDIVKVMYSDGKSHQIVLLSLADMMRARRSGEWRTMVLSASLIIPISASIVRTARFLHKPLPVRYEPFDFIVKLLGILAAQGKSAYLFGASPKGLAQTAHNIKATFPGLHVVGSHSARFPKSFHGKIVEAIRKAAPTLLLIGEKIPGGERWIPRNKNNLAPGIRLWCSDVFEVFAERKGRPPAGLFNRGLEWMYYMPKRPWTVFRFFTVFRLKIIAFWYRIRGK